MEQTGEQIIVAILGENVVVGKALESLLQTGDYVAQFFPEHPCEPVEPLDEAGLALLLPVLNSRRRKAVLRRIRSTPATAGLPIIELTASPDNSRGSQETQVSWPCGIEELTRHIDAVLLSGSKTLNAF